MTPLSPIGAPAMNVAAALAWARQSGLVALDAELLLLHALEKRPSERAWLRAHADTDLPAQRAQAFVQRVLDRMDQLPLAYLTGHKAFYGLQLHISPDVLDPRPDTETLVDWALGLISPDKPCHVCDLGTGSGAVALAIASQRPAATVCATDISEPALAIAQSNAAELRLAVQFLHGAWTEPLVAHGLMFDLLVSNPPYIAQGDPHLPALRHEPLGALVSGTDGLDDIRHIVAESPVVLRHGGWLLLEHGYDQADDVAALMEKQGFVHVQPRKDLAGIARCTGGQWQPAPERR